MLKTNTLRAKFLLSFVVISLAYIVISSFFILRMVNSANNRMAKAGFVRWASDFETMAEPNFIYFNYMNLKAQAEEILKNNTCDFIVLFDAEGKEIFFKGPDWIRADLEPYRADGDERVLEVPFRSSPYFLISLPVKIAGGDTVWGRILFGHSNEENASVLARLRLYVIIISGVLLLVFIAVIVIINRKLTEPIKLLKNGLEKISYGDFSHRIQIHSNDEFSFLGNQFNEMAEKIESMLSEIEATHRDLEKQVAARTRELNESNQKLQVAMQELRDTQRHIIQSEKQKSLTAIVSGFAHEINNPLTGILGYVDLIGIREDASPYIREKLNSIQKQAVRIKNIIDQLNQLNPDMEQVKMETQPVQPAGKTGQGRLQPPGKRRVRHRAQQFPRRCHHPWQPLRPLAGVRGHHGERHRGPARKQYPERPHRHRPEALDGRRPGDRGDQRQRRRLQEPGQGLRPLLYHQEPHPEEGDRADHRLQHHPGAPGQHRHPQQRGQRGHRVGLPEDS